MEHSLAKDGAQRSRGCYALDLSHDRVAIFWPTLHETAYCGSLSAAAIRRVKIKRCTDMFKDQLMFAAKYLSHPAPISPRSWFYENIVGIQVGWISLLSTIFPIRRETVSDKVAKTLLDPLTSWQRVSPMRLHSYILFLFQQGTLSQNMRLLVSTNISAGKFDGSFRTKWRQHMQIISTRVCTVGCTTTGEENQQACFQVSPPLATTGDA